MLYNLHLNMLRVCVVMQVYYSAEGGGGRVDLGTCTFFKGGEGIIFSRDKVVISSPIEFIWRYAFIY